MKFLKVISSAFKLLLWIVIPAALAVGGLFLYSQTRDWNQEADKFATAIYDITGRKFFIKGGADFKFFPRPTLTIKDARLDNINGATTDAFISIPEAVITPSLLALLTGSIGIDDITIKNPIFAMEILPDGRKSWDITPKTGAGGNVTSLAQVTIENGTVKAYNQETKYETKLFKISGKFNPKGTQGSFLFNGELGRDDMKVGVTADVGALVGQGIIPLSLSLKYGVSDFGFKGTLQDIATPDGTVNLTLDAMVAHPLLPLGKYLITPEGEKRVKITGVFNGKRSVYTFSNLVLEGAAIAGSGEGFIDLSKPRPNVKLNLLLANADFAAQTLLTEGATSLAPVVPKELAVNDPAFRVSDIGFGKYNEIDLLKDVDMVVDLGLTQAQFRKELIRDVRININSVEGGGLEIRNISARLPGDTTFEAKGVVEDEQTVSDMAGRFTGNVKLYGDSLKQFLNWLQVDLPPIPQEKLNAFAASANIIYSQTFASMPALVARFDDTSITGGNAEVSTDPNKPSQIALTMENLNLDDYLPKLDDLIKEEGGSAQEAQYAAINATQRKFDFLRVVEVNFGTTDMQFTLNNLTYKGELVTKASSKIKFGSARLEFSDLDIISKNVQMRGKVTIDASSLKPSITAELDVEDFNTDDVPGIRVFFAPTHTNTEKPEDNVTVSDRWSTNDIDLNELKAYNGKARIFFRSLTHQKVLFENMTMNLRLQDNFLYADSIRATMFDGGKLDGKGILNITNLPSLSVSFALSNSALKDAMYQFFGVKAVTDGRFSASGSVSTMGRDIGNMMSRLEGSLNLIVRAAEIESFDFIALTQELSKVLTIKQVREIADNALRSEGGNGTMYYDYAAGSVIMNGGNISLNGLQLLSPNFPPLNLNGNVNLTSWEYDVELKTGLPLDKNGGFELRREANANDVPVTARITGSIDKPMLVWDKNPIEKYWEKRFYR